MPGMMEKGPELLGRGPRAANGGGAKSPAGGGSGGGGGGAAATNGALAASEPESGGSSSDDEHDVGMRVGAEYQARIPEFDPGFPGGHGTRAPTRIGPELSARRQAPGWSLSPARSPRGEGPDRPAGWWMGGCREGRALVVRSPHAQAWAPLAALFLPHTQPKEMAVRRCRAAPSRLCCLWGLRRAGRGRLQLWSTGF